MVPPRHLHASPLPSFASRPDVVPRYVSFVETVGAVWSWLIGRKPTLWQRTREQRIIDAMIEEAEAEQPKPEGER